MSSTHKERTLMLEQVEKKPILAVAEALGMTLVREGRTYTWAEHDSMVITPHKNLFYWNAQQKGGGVIQLVMMVKNTSYKEAVSLLNNMDVGSFKELPEPKKAPFHYFMAEHKDETISYNYLLKERKLSKETIEFFKSEGLLAQVTYKNKKFNSEEPAIAFKHKDLGGKVRSISLQGIEENFDRYEKRGRLKKTIGDGFYGMSVRVGKPPTGEEATSEHPIHIIAFESPIDLMSYYELKKDTIGNAILLSMNGFRKGTISTYLANELGSTVKEEEKQHVLDNMQKIYTGTTDKIKLTLAVDNDEAARKFVDTFGISFIEVNSELPESLVSKNKMDWNDVLKESKSHIMEDNSMTETLEAERYFQVEMNETNLEIGIVNFEGQKVTTELINKIQELETVVGQKNQGYYKFYFEEVVNGKIVDTLRLDVGDGISVNSDIYKTLKEGAVSLDTTPFIEPEISKLDSNLSKDVNVSKVMNSSHSPFLSDFTSTLDQTFKDMASQKEGSLNYLTKEEVESALDEHLTKIEQLIANFNESASLLENPTEEDNQRLHKGLIETIKLVVIDFKNSLIQTFNYGKDVAIYNVKETTDNLRLSIKNNFNGRILRVSQSIQKFSTRIEGKFSIEEKKIRPHPKEGVQKKSESEKNITEQEPLEPENEILEESPTDNLVDLTRKYLSLIEEKSTLETSIYETIQSNPVANLSAIQEELVKVKEGILSIEETITASNSSKNMKESLSQFTQLSELIAKRDDLVQKRDELVKQPDFLRSNGREEQGESSLSQFKLLDSQVSIIEQEIVKVEQAYNESLITEEKQSIPEGRPAMSKKESGSFKPKTASQEKSELKNDAKLVDDLTKTPVDLLEPKAFKQYLDTAGQFHTYSPKNIQLIMQQAPDVTQVASLDKWKKQGYQVNENAKPIYVYAPQIVSLTDEQGHPQLDNNGKQKEEVSFYLKPIYDIRDTTAASKERKQPLTIETAKQFHDVYEGLSQTTKATVTIGPIEGEKASIYDEKTNTLTVSDGLGKSETLRELIKESAILGLAANAPVPRSKHGQELRSFETEAVSYIVSNHLGLDVSHYEFDYLSYLKENQYPSSKLNPSLTAISKQSVAMIEQIEKNIATKKTTSPNKFEERVKQGTRDNQLGQTSPSQTETQVATVRR